MNTWNSTRLEVVGNVMQRMGLVSVLPWIDTRSRCFGHQVDYVFVRDLEVVYAEAPDVGSSDHNPVLATLRVAGRFPVTGSRPREFHYVNPVYDEWGSC